MSKNTETKTTLAYVVLCSAIAAGLEEAGVELKDQKMEVDGVPGNAGWACFERKDSGHKIYVSRSATKGIVHTTLKLDPSLPGFVPMAKSNGKIESHYEADVAKVMQHLIPLFVAAKEPIRANKPAVRKIKNADGTPVVEAQTIEQDDVTDAVTVTAG